MATNFFFLLAITLPLLVYGALSGLTFDANTQEFVALQFAFLQIVLFQLAVGVAIAQGPLSRLYTLPISTYSIVAWHMFSGATILALEIVGAAWLFNVLFHVEWPIVGPALFAVAAWSAFQVLMSATSLRSVPAFLFAVTPAVLLCLWLGTRYGSFFSPPTHCWSELTPTEVVTLLGATCICHVITTYSIGLARCGERMPTFGIGNWLDKRWESYLTTRSAPPRFRSAVAAHFWYEWQVKGIALPLITIIVLLCAIVLGLGGLFYQTTTLNALYEVVLFLGAFISLLACAAGLFLGLEVDAKPKGQRETQVGDTVSEMQFESGMGSFLSSRPFATKDFAKVFLRVAAQNALVSWLMWAALFACCLLTLWLTKHTPESFMPREIGILFVPMTILGPWIAMANLGAIGLSGRGTKILIAFVACAVSYFVLLGSINCFTNALVIQQVHTVCMIIAALVVVIASIGVFILARYQKLVTTTTSLFALLGSCAIAIIAILLRPTEIQSIYYPMVVIIAALVTLPFSSMPLAIAWNRHR